MTPVQFFNRFWTPGHCLWGENNQLHKWKVSSTGALAYIANGHEFASVDAREHAEDGRGAHGRLCALDRAMVAIRTRRSSTCTIPYCNANKRRVSGAAAGLDPVHLAADGFIKVLWDSQQFGIPFLFNKFNPPLIDGGQVYCLTITVGWIFIS